jgi:muramoyltetrapeptide carboxypeptidase
MSIKPRGLGEGSTIGIVAPSNSASFIDERVWRIGVDRLRSKGFDLRFGSNIMELNGHTAGTVQQRLEDIMGMFEDPEIDGIMTVYGGFNSHQLLHYIDFDAIEKNPKVFIGFSDITALNTAILERSGLINFSGPAFITFCQPDLPVYTEKCFDAIVTRGERYTILPSEKWAEDDWWKEPINFGKREWKPNGGWNTYSVGNAVGEAIGGNLSTLMLLAGTEYWPEMEGRILFLDDDGTETTQTLDRYLTQLRHIGVYDQISGLVMGRLPSSVGFKPGDTLEMILDEVLRGYDIPVVTGVDFAHTDPLTTIPLGVRVMLDADDQRIEMMERAVG